MADYTQLKPQPKGVATQEDFKSHLYILSRKNSNPTLESCHYPKSYGIKAEDEVYMSWTDKDGQHHTGNRIIRLVQGQTSIFADEQSEVNPNPKKVKRIRFIDGFLVVDGKDKLQRQFLDLCNWNRANAEFRMDGKTELFYKEDRESKGIQGIDLKKKIFELQGKVFESTEAELDAYCLTFEVRNYNNMNVNEKRTILLDMVAFDPLKFEKEMNSDERKRKYWIMKAFEEKVFQVSANKSEIQYTIGGIRTICDVPSINTNHIEYLTELSFKSVEVNELIEKTIKILKQPIIKANTTALASPNNDNEYQALYKSALETKVIYKAGAWTKFTDKTMSDINLGKSMADFEVMLRDNHELYGKITMMVAEAKEVRGN
jgi:hypothetical protein